MRKMTKIRNKMSKKQINECFFAHSLFLAEFAPLPDFYPLKVDDIVRKRIILDKVYK